MAKTSRERIKRAAIIAAIALAVAGGAWLLLKGRTIDIEIAQQELQQKLDKKFPIKKTYSLVVILGDVVCQNPRVVLTEGSDRVGAGLDVVVTLQLRDGPKSFQGSFDVTFGIDFNPETGQLFLTDMQFVHMDLPGVPDVYVSRIRQAATSVAQDVLKDIPVYQLTAKDAKTTIAKLIVKGAVVRNGALIVTLGV